ncbi:hypothetical protein BH11CYA1_BH11CYA1_32970 [soil metagenome]
MAGCDNIRENHLIPLCVALKVEEKTTNTARQGLWRCLFLAPIAYLLLAPRVNMRLYRKLLFHPTSFPELPSGNLPRAMNIEPEELYFNSFGDLDSKETLHGWYFQHPNQDAPLVIFSHGNSGNLTMRLPLFQTLLESGASVFIYDYRGFGKSTGAPTVEGVNQDGLAAYDFIVKKFALPASRIFLYGESLGAAVSSYIASKRKAAGLVLQSGFSSLRNIGGERVRALKLYPSWLFPMPGTSSSDILAAEHPPLLIIHGMLDKAVAFHHAQALYECASQPKQLLALPVSGHSDLVATAKETLKENLSAFFIRFS